MTLARNELVCLDETHYYHVISRCVRRAWLCGIDPLTGKNHEHRRQWIAGRIAHLTSAFCIDVCAYSIMSNHYHLALRVDREAAQGLDQDALLARISKLWSLPFVVESYVAGNTSDAESNVALAWIAERRQRLYSLSWFMKELNQGVACLANHEDQVTGRFWEGRFTSQALTSERAVLACMVYIDLNPVRAKVASTPETSDFTSIQQRIRFQRGAEGQIRLLPFKDAVDAVIPIGEDDYYTLVDYTGRAVVHGKRGSIDPSLPDILERLGHDAKSWQRSVDYYGKPFWSVAGVAPDIRRYARSLGRHWFKGLTEGEVAFAKN